MKKNSTSRKSTQKRKSVVAPKKVRPVSTTQTRLKEKIVRLERQALVAERLRYESLKKSSSKSWVAFDAGTFIAGVAHEFNNILGAADGHAEWGLESNTLDEMREALTVVRAACARSAKITKSLSTLLQPREENKTLFSLQASFGEVGRLFRARADKEGVHLNLAPTEVQVYGDPVRFLEVLVNLIKNAFDAFLTPLTPWKRPDSLLVEVKVEVPKGKNSRVRILIQDNGPGVPPAIENSLFRPFFTTKGTLSKALADASAVSGQAGDAHGIFGSGLGLFLSRQIIEEQGGELNLLRQKNGAAFEITLPRA